MWFQVYLEGTCQKATFPVWDQVCTLRSQQAECMSTSGLHCNRFLVYITTQYVLIVFFLRKMIQVFLVLYIKVALATGVPFHFHFINVKSTDERPQSFYILLSYFLVTYWGSIAHICSFLPLHWAGSIICIKSQKWQVRVKEVMLCLTPLCCLLFFPPFNLLFHFSTFLHLKCC